MRNSFIFSRSGCKFNGRNVAMSYWTENSGETVMCDIAVLSYVMQYSLKRIIYMQYFGLSHLNLKMAP